MSRGRVLVTDAETRSVLAAARGLADAGFEVAAAAASDVRLAAAHWSRSVSERLVLPDPLTAPGAYLAALERVVRDAGFAALIPGNDASVLAVSAGRARIEPYVRLGLPDHESVRRCLDKSELAAAGARHGLAPPPSVVSGDAVEAVAAARELGFPVLAKPVSSIVEDATPPRRLSSVLARNAGEVEDALAACGGSMIVQRRVAGEVVSFAGVFAGGRLLGEAFSRYRRTWRPQAGNACYSRTADAPAPLRQRVTSLLADLAWEGLFELELIETAEDSDWHAIDMNPRPYGSMALAIGAGANLPAIWCEHLLGETPSEARAIPGVLYRWTDADLRHGLSRLRAGQPAAAVDVLRARRGTVHPYARAGDPGPGLVRLMELGGMAGKRAPLARGHRGPSPASRAPVVIIGAGPNGLAVAAHLRHAGIETLSFGETLEAWSRHMPAGMLLRSRRRSTHISDPRQELTIDAYERAEGRRVGHPNLTLEEFIDYGSWFQRQAAPEVDSRKVTGVARHNGGFQVTLADGERLDAARVIVAAGLSPFIYRPEPYTALPASACSHAYEHADLHGFAGRRVIVIGSGQSALESAALLHEAGVTVEVLARAPSIYWLREGDEQTSTAGAAKSRRLAVTPPPTDVGGRLTGWIAAAPDVFRRVPRSLRPTVSYRCIRPAGAGWLRPRLLDVPISCDCEVTEAQGRGDTVTLRLADGATRTADHVLLGTGYRVDVRRYPFLAPELAAELVLDGGYPVLGPGLESSVAGLHFMGAPAAASFGPIMRFVVGSWYAAPAVARRAADRRQPPVSFAFPTGRRARGA
jgi:predicted ATP-grasp superfamily ATP-dependent carboligase